MALSAGVEELKVGMFPYLGVKPMLGFTLGLLLIKEKKSSLNPILGSFIAYL